MINLIAISFIIISIYTVYILKTIGINKLPSLSESYYHTKWKFQVALFLSGALLVPVLLQVTTEMFQFIAFFTTAPILFVSVAPKFKNKDIEHKVHVYSATIAAISSIVWSLFMLKLMFIPLAMIIVSLYMVFTKKYKQKVFIGEMMCFLIVYITLLLQFIK